MSKAYLFIRNDDVCSLTSSFQFFFEQMLGRELPVVYAVIPGKMEKSLVHFIRRAKERYPHLLDIVQHGWMHTNYSSDRKQKYEFGMARDFETQRQDIQKGKQLMDKAFGDYFTKAFVPPFHGYDQQTIKALTVENFSMFSAGTYDLAEPLSLKYLPAMTSFSQYGKGTVKIYSAKEVLRQWIRNMTKNSLSGIVTHHEDFNTHYARKEMARFFNLIEKRMRQGKLQIFLFSDLEKLRSCQR